VHSQIRQDNKGTAENGETHAVLPQRQGVKAKGAENRRARHFDIKAVLVIDEGKIADLVDDEALEGVVEDGELQNNQNQYC
jgi:hypothetical protein